MPSDGTASNIQQIGWVMLQTMYTGSRRIYRRSQAGHRTSTSLRLPDLYSCEFGFVRQWWLLCTSFQWGYVAFDLFFPFPSRTLPRSLRTRTDNGLLRSSVSLPGIMPIFYFHGARQLWTLYRQFSPMITSRREGNINKQTKLKQKTKDKTFFAFDRRSVGPLCPTCVWVPQPAHDLAGGAANSLATASNRPHTQPDVADCWPCCHCTRDAWSPWSPARLPFTHLHSPSVFWTTPRKQCNQASPRSRSLQPFQKCKKGLARCHLTTAHYLVCG